MCWSNFEKWTNGLHLRHFSDAQLSLFVRTVEPCDAAVLLKKKKKTTETVGLLTVRVS